MSRYDHVEVEAMKDQMFKVIHYGGFKNSFKTDKLEDVVSLLDALIIHGEVTCEPEEECSCINCDGDYDKHAGDDDGVGVF